MSTEECWVLPYGYEGNPEAPKTRVKVVLTIWLWAAIAGALLGIVIPIGLR